MHHWLAITLTATLLALSSAAELVLLTDETFEHQTQASTGQTTGKWFVMFGAVWCGYACNKLNPILEELNVEGVLTARVDTTANTETGRRFEIYAHPTLLFFANRQMYPYHGEQTKEAIEAFVSGGYAETEGKPVPPPPGFVAVQLKKLNEFVESNKHLKYLKDDFEHIVEIRKNAAVALVLIGAIIGFMMGCLLGCSTGKKKAAASSKAKTS